jgi:hypothetical protein
MKIKILIQMDIIKDIRKINCLAGIAPQTQGEGLGWGIFVDLCNLK